MKKKSISVVIGLALVIAFIYAGCEMSVNDPVRAVPVFEPYISVQPLSHSFTAGTTDFSPAFPLKVEVWEWDRLDGSLTYQWYSFTTLKQFYDNDAQEITGATASSFTPTNLVSTAGARNYYYVVVTNTNPDATGGRLSAEITSDVAIISFNETGAPAVPEILQNPGNSAYTLGRVAAVAPLDVRATAAAAPSGETTALRYQWYRFALTDGFDANGYPQGTAIPNALSRTYLPSEDDLGAGDNYYYVVVANVRTDPNGEVLGRSEVYSLPAKITMELGAEAAEPRIDGHPRNLMYFTGTTLDANSPKLSVNAASIDRGTLSYQWYSTTTGSTTLTDAGVTLIDDAEDAEYLPTIATGSAGASARYFVVVTNTNDLVTGNTTASLTSKVATVSVAAAASGAILNSNLTVAVNPDTKFNYIRGYGGMEVAWANFPETTMDDMENMYNPDKLGYNILRIMIPPSNTNVELGVKDYVDRHRPNYYEYVKVVNKYGGYVLASPWSPPREWKSNKSINGGGHLVHSYYKQYANYLRSFARHMSAKGAPIYAISIQNEPNYVAGYDGCEWEPEEMRDFFKQVGRFTQGVRGFGGGKVTPTVLTMNGESANTPDINHAAIDDPVSFAAIDLFARHVYGEQTKNLWTSRPQVQQSGKEVWMTEHNINSASSTAFPNDWTWDYIWAFMNDVDLVMRISNENAFVWWASRRFYSYVGDGEANTVGGTILPRGWGLAHYAKFTIDMTRVDTTVTGNLGTATGPAVSATNTNFSTFSLDNVSVRITAYVSRDGNEISLVMWAPTNKGVGGNAMGNVKIQLPAGWLVRSATGMRSTSSNLTADAAARMEAVAIGSDRNTAYVSVPRGEILSVKFTREAE